MKREDVIRMAEEAGAKFDMGWGIAYNCGNETFFRFAKLVAAAERERCAKVCEERGERNRISAGLPNGDRDEFYCADDIRSLNNEV